MSSASELSPSDSGSQAMIEEMNRVIRKVVKILQSAAQRCIRLTQATELDTFFVIADDCFQGFVLNLKVRLVIAVKLLWPTISSQSSASLQKPQEAFYIYYCSAGHVTQLSSCASPAQATFGVGREFERSIRGFILQWGLSNTNTAFTSFIHAPFSLM